MHSEHWKMAHDVSMSGSIATGFIVTTLMLLCPLFYKLLQVSEIWQAVNIFSGTRRRDKVFRYSFWETIPMFLNFGHLKSDFILLRLLRSFTSDWIWIKVCQNTVFIKLDITMTTVKKNFEIDTEIRILRDLDLPACRRLLFPLLHAEKGLFSACNKGNRRRLHAGKI